MTTALTTRTFDADQLALIKSTIAPETTNNELQLFIYQCERTGLDPFAKQIYCIKRAGKAVIQISIDGARLIAERTDKYEGQEGPYWCDGDGEWHDVWLSSDPPKAAKVLVWKAGARVATPGVAHWNEYAPYYKGQLADMWKKMPALMLAKCAEMLALRKAFPQELSGLYSREEMQQADTIDANFRTVDAATGEILPPTPPTPRGAPPQPPRNGVERDVDLGMAKGGPQAKGDSSDNPFEDTPWYVAARGTLTNGVARFADAALGYHRDGGPASAKQYGYLSGLLDSIVEQATGAEDAHRRVLTVLCQTEITDTNPPSAVLASKLLDKLATHKKVNGTKVPNADYDQAVADAVIAIYRAAEAVGTPTLFETATA